MTYRYRGVFRITLLFVCATICLCALIGRLAYINGWYINSVVLPNSKGGGTTLDQYLTEQQSSTIPIAARRGEILDRAGRVLAGSQERPSIYLDLSLIADAEFVSAKISPILQMPARELRKLIDENKQADKTFLWLKRRADKEQGEAVLRLKSEETTRSKQKKNRVGPEQDRLVGVGIMNEPMRTYPMHKLAAHVVGFVDIDGKGQEGTERQFDKTLRGTPGSVTLYRDARRRPIWSANGSDAYIPPADGMSLKLTLDVMIQEFLERYIESAVTHFKAESGVGVIMDPKTGEVLAMASNPTFDLNTPAKFPVDARRNRVLTDPCEPGSTFKPFVAAAALAENVVKKGEIFNCENGSYAVGGRVLHDHHPYGALTFEQVMIKSSNIGMAKFGQRLGNDKMHRYLSAPLGFGFGSRTGIELPGEDPGLLLPLRIWTTFSTTSIPMGQEISVTPLQLANAFCSIVNGGKAVKPHIVKAIVDPRGNTVEEFNPKKDARQIIPKDVAEYMTKTVLTAVVNEGTGSRSQLDKWQVLGKTGTAQIAAKGGRGYEPNAYTSSYISAAPASDPTIVVLIMIRKPNRSIAYYGGTVAAPAVREVLRHTLAYMEVPPDKDPTKEPVKSGTVTASD